MCLIVLSIKIVYVATYVCISNDLIVQSEIWQYNKDIQL